MGNEAQFNLTKMAFSNVLEDAFAYWAMNQDKSFLVCFDDSLKKNCFKLENNGVEVNKPTREILKDTITGVKSSAVVQMICYMYELLYKNYDPGLSNDKVIFDKLKGNILRNANNSFNNEQLLSHIRNAISHNDDMDGISYDYSYISNLFTFLPAKKKNNNGVQVIISEDELVELFTCYINNMKGFKQLDYILEVNNTNIYSSKPVLKTKDFIKLKNKKTGEYILPDDYQINVIRELIKRIRSSEIKEIDNLNFFYPYKQNSLNNYIRISDFYHMLNCLYKLRGCTFEEFMQKSGMNTPSFLSEYKNFGDIGSAFVVNRLFQVFSTTPTKVLQQELSKTAEYIKFGKLRNAIMHGTYYKDIDANLYLYDAPRENKTEEGLEFIDKFDLEELEILSSMFFHSKYFNSNRK